MAVFDRVLLATGLEATFKQGGTPNLQTDVVDVGNFTLTPSFSRLERNVHRADFSRPPSRIGTRTMSMSFNKEVNGSGVTNGSRPPDWGRLLRACGFAQTQFTAPALALARAHPENARVAPVTLSGAATAYTGTMSRMVSITMTSPTQATVLAHETPNGDVAYTQTGVAVTSGTAIPGPQGATMTLTFTGAMVAGDRYFFWFVPPGHLYTPASATATQESAFLHVYLDGKRHVMNGALGTFSMSATAGEIASFDFNFTGDFQKPTDVAFPASYSYGGYPLPPMVELADLSLDNVLLACPTTVAFDVANDIGARACINAAGGTNGSRLTGRNPTASFNMDSVPITTTDIWGMLETGQQVELTSYIGTKPGNFVQFFGNGQITNAQYANLDSQRKVDNTMALTGLQGSDELLIFAG